MGGDDNKNIADAIMDMAKGLESGNGDLASILSQPQIMNELLGEVTGKKRSIDEVDNDADDGDNDNDNDNDEKEEEETEQTILEEYKLWRKNCRYMYSFVSETALTWPSLSIQFIKSNTFENKMKDSKFGVTRNLLLTTHSNGEDDDFIKLASLQLPKSFIKKDFKLTNEELETVNSRLKINKKFKQDIEVNKIRVNPFNSNIWSSINAKGEVFIYNIDSKMNEISKIELKHHKLNGFGLSWNPNNQFQLITGSEDKSIAIWDYNKSNLPNKIYNIHNNFVNDVRFSFKKENLFGSVGEDKFFCIGDIREDKILNKKILNKDTSFNSFTFSKFSENLILFGGEDSNNYIYDLRKLDNCLHTLIGHKKSITNVEWDPFHENIVASSSMDRRVILWDLNKIGEEQLQEESEDGVPELLMMHGGHTGGVNDFTFNNEIEWCLASCSDDNIVHVWGVKDEIVFNNDEEFDVDVDPSILE